MSDATPTRRVHPATIAINTPRNVPIVGVGMFLLLERGTPVDATWLLLALVPVTLISLGLSYLSWTRVRFGFDDDGDFRLNSGVMFQKQHKLVLSRLQAVDVVRPLLARAFGMASVRVEVAGAAAAVVEYLPEAQAQALRQEVLDRAGGRAAAQEMPAPEEHLLHVSGRELFVSLLLDHRTIVGIVVTFLGVSAVVLLAGPGAVFAYGLALLVPVATVLAEFTTWYDFTLARSTDGARIRSGLLSTRAQTVPPGRVHAIELSQPLLWRRRDWVRVSMNIAGTGAGDRENAVATVLVPVARREDAMRVIAMVLPQWRIEGVAFDPAPEAASRRAWIQHRQLGLAVTADLFIARRGRFVRRTAAVPHGRVQSVRVVQGPWQRVLGLASVRADTVPGAVRVRALHRAADQARQVADTEAGLMRQARTGAQHLRWLEHGP